MAKSFWKGKKKYLSLPKGEETDNEWQQGELLEKGTPGQGDQGAQIECSRDDSMEYVTCNSKTSAGIC